MKNKKIFILAPLFLSFFIPSCTNKNSEYKLSSIISNSKDVVINKLKAKEEYTNDVINNFIDLAYGSQSSIEKDKYIKSQKENHDILLAQAKEFSVEIKKNKRNYLFSENSYLKKYNDWFSENWLFVLLNINKFYGEFKEFYFLKYNDGILNSDKYIGDVSKNKGTNAIFPDKNISDIKDSKGENSHMSDKKYYFFLINKSIFRICFKNENLNKKTVIFEPFVCSFTNSEADKISLTLIETIYHNVVFHGEKNESDIDMFEKTMVEHLKYNYPTTSVILLK
ncbi:aromatic motif membrane protein [Mycoplasma elephantis]|uniref:aromatic motif membrane protein n=1 Tax=Mycoplasma elephantis TaxID=114882 RepID=UPI0004801C17|nr:aromatic motif membrane protein [Mycoplasma elephantis]